MGGIVLLYGVGRKGGGGVWWWYSGVATHTIRGIPGNVKDLNAFLCIFSGGIKTASQAHDCKKIHPLLQTSVSGQEAHVARRFYGRHGKVCMLIQKQERVFL